MQFSKEIAPKCGENAPSGAKSVESCHVLGCHGFPWSRSLNLGDRLKKPFKESQRRGAGYIHQEARVLLTQHMLLGMGAEGDLPSECSKSRDLIAITICDSNRASQITSDSEKSPRP